MERGSIWSMLGNCKRFSLLVPSSSREGPSTVSCHDEVALCLLMCALNNQVHLMKMSLFTKK